jgi:putative serine protease PepD
MSIRDGLEPSRSPGSETHTQPLPGNQATTPGNEAAADQGDRAPTPTPPSSRPADDAWPPSWGKSPAWGRTPSSPDDPTWTRPSPSPDDPSWTQPAAARADTPTWTEPPGATGPSWTQAQTQTGPAQGGGHPTTPTWGTRPAGGGSPRSRGPSRWLAAVVAGIVLLASGYGISQVLDRDDNAPAGAGIPTAAPSAATPAVSGSASSVEPAAAVAKALLPTVVEIRQGSGLGSGFVYDKNGYIMTAAHVVQGADQVQVRLYDGTKLTGKVVGTDEANDVAVVKVDRTGLAAAPLALGETIQVGQLAVAIGSPFGLNETVTAGIISATDRNLEGREVIQTDAPINPGNSGGVLADRRGRVIGINDAIQTGSESNGNVGIGFAIPIDLAARSATAIVQGKQVKTGYLGVTLGEPTGNQDGALVQDVAPGSPAAKAGLQPGDLVVAIDGQSVADYGELGARIRGHRPGDKVTLKVVRDGNETTITATLSERPAG